MELGILYRQHAQDGNGQDPTPYSSGHDAEARQAEGEAIVASLPFSVTLVSFLNAEDE
jgi:hypothetical protein